MALQLKEHLYYGGNYEAGSVTPVLKHSPACPRCAQEEIISVIREKRDELRKLNTHVWGTEEKAAAIKDGSYYRLRWNIRRQAEEQILTERLHAMGAE